MNEAISKKTCMVYVFCIATLLFVLSVPMTSYGGDSCSGDYEITVNVAPNIVNITSQGDGHAVVVHTNQDFTIVNLEQTQVFVNDGDDEDGDNGDCQIASFGQREDDNGNLDIYFPLDELKLCDDSLEINDEFNILRIEGIEKKDEDDTEEITFCGESDMHIVGKQGPGKP